jgi:HEPN domain-containing protein
MRENPQNEGLRWIEQAKIDLQWAGHLNSEGAYYLVCFLAQQSAEKALKAFLYARGEEIVIGHSVRVLCARAAEYEAEFQDHADEWAILDTYYIPTRYPNGLPDDIPARVYNRAAAEDSLKLSNAVIRHVDKWFDLPKDNN